MPIIDSPADGADVAELRAEVTARGYALSPARVLRCLNTAHRILCSHELWPFLEDTASGSAPLEIEDLRTIRCVRETASGLYLSYEPFSNDVRALLETPGAASRYTVTGGYTVEVVYAGAHEISVDYYRRPGELVEETDQVFVPQEFTDVLVDAACREAAKDAREWGEVAALAVEVNAGLDRMTDVLMTPSIEPIVLELPDLG
jgi:hypothetical protein